MQVYLMNLVTGNGAWLSLPVDSDTIIITFLKEKKITTPADEEFIIADYDYDDELSLRIDDLDNVYHLNELLNLYITLNDYDRNKILAYLESNGNSISDFDDALSNYDDFTLLEDIKNEYDLGEYYLANTLYGIKDKFPINLLYYFDYEAFGRDLVYGGDFTLTTYGALL